MLFPSVKIRCPDGDFRSLLRRIQQESKITTAYVTHDHVTHDQTEAMNMSDRRVVMNAEITASDIDVGAENQVVVATRPQGTPNEIGANLHIGW